MMFLIDTVIVVELLVLGSFLTAFLFPLVVLPRKRGIITRYL